MKTKTKNRYYLYDEILNEKIDTKYCNTLYGKHQDSFVWCMMNKYPYLNTDPLMFVETGVKYIDAPYLS